MQIRTEAHSKQLTVVVTSLAGHLTHSFDRHDKVGEVHHFAYDRLVKQKDQIPLDRTWIEWNDQRQDDAIRLAALVHEKNEAEHEGHEDRHETDVTLALAWDTGGGRG